MGLEAVEQIEVITAELALKFFAKYAEIRMASGAMANLCLHGNLQAAATGHCAASA
jgi:glycine/serine hydroxymethyltransferase